MTEQEAINALKEHKEMIDKEYIKTRNSKAIEVVLNALKEKDKTIEKLRKDNTIFALEGSRIALKHYIENNYIPVQKVKDTVDKIQEEGYWLFTTNNDSDKCVEVLQQLLEEKQ